MSFQLVREQFIPLGIEETFAFFSDARNLERLTPARLHFRVLNQGAVALASGSLLEYRLRIRGFQVRWQSGIEVWDPPNKFVDSQRRGPYKSWHDGDTFVEVRQGTVVRDQVTYDVWGGLLAPLLNRLIVRPDLGRIFDFRARWLDAWATEQPGRQPIGLTDSACFLT